MRRSLPPEISCRLEGIKPSGEGYVARCPTHEDRSPSLKLTVTDEGKLLVHCHAGCDPKDILDAIQATPAQIHGEDREQAGQLRGEWTPRGDTVAIYHYVDEAGSLLFDVCRTADKQFPQRRPDSAKKGGWTWSLGECRRVLYRLPQVITAVQGGQTVWIAEGEKDVHALEAKGAVATCSPGGAGKWRDEYAEFLREATVTVVADKDKPGQAHARAVAVSLGRVGCRVRIVEAKEGKDAADHLSAGGCLDDFLVTFQPEEAVKPDLAPDLWDFLDGEDAGFEWLIPGLLERNDRLMITGFEGWGKSTLTRQLALALASGVHPFEPMVKFPPARVLFIDCENSERQLRRGLLRIIPPVIGKYASTPARDQMYVINKTGGVDLTGTEDAQWLVERAVAHKPDVIFLGPLYYLYAEGGNDEAVMRKVQAVIDVIRRDIQCAFIIEAHPGHGQAGQHRSTRVAGSSVWMRWLESGIGMADYDATDIDRGFPVKVTNWKKHRFERCWPTHLTHGEYDAREQEHRTWPWVPHETDYRMELTHFLSTAPPVAPSTPREHNTADIAGSRIQRSTPAEERYNPRDGLPDGDVSNPSTHVPNAGRQEGLAGSNGTGSVQGEPHLVLGALNGSDEGLPEPPIDFEEYGSSDIF